MLDGYVRVSRTAGREGDSFQSPAQQRAAIASWAASRGVTIGEWHEDLDVSGGTLTRPGLDALVARIRNGETGGIAVARLDRLSRAGVGDALRLVEEIHEAGGQVAALDLGVDPTTPFGELALTLMLALARMERRRIADGWIASRAAATSRGVMIGPAPLGYRRTDIGTLEVDDDTAPIVTHAYKLAASNGVHAALAYLREQTPERNWADVGTVRRFLARRVVLGELSDGTTTKTDAHTAIVERSVWRAAQLQSGPRRRSASDYPLTHLAVCASCGAGMIGGRNGGKVNGVRKRRYRCSARGACAEPAAIIADALEQLVETATRNAIDHIRASADLLVGPAGPTGELEAAQSALDNAIRNLATVADEPAAVERLAELRDARDAAVARVDTAGRRSVILDADLDWDVLDAQERDAVTRATIERVVVHPGRGTGAERITVAYVGDDAGVERVVVGAARRMLSEG